MVQLLFSLFVHLARGSCRDKTAVLLMTVNACWLDQQLHCAFSKVPFILTPHDARTVGDVPAAKRALFGLVRNMYFLYGAPLQH
jgi:hypothetical protein